MTGRWDTPSALTGLLDALESDLFGASAEEVGTALSETGRARESAVRELRSLLRDAEADGHDSCPFARSSDKRDRIDTQWH
jgi:hypothetical protein